MYFNNDEVTKASLKELFKKHLLICPDQFRNDFGDIQSFDDWFIETEKEIELKTGVPGRERAEFFSTGFIDALDDIVNKSRKYINEKYMDNPGVTYQHARGNFYEFLRSPNNYNPISKAFRRSGEKVLISFEDIGNPRGRWYAGYLLYDYVSDTIQTWGNMSFGCPNRHHHHVGSTCQCCLQKG